MATGWVQQVCNGNPRALHLLTINITGAMLASGVGELCTRRLFVRLRVCVCVCVCVSRERRGGVSSGHDTPRLGGICLNAPHPTALYLEYVL